MISLFSISGASPMSCPIISIHTNFSFMQWCARRDDDIVDQIVCDAKQLIMIKVLCSAIAHNIEILGIVMDHRRQGFGYKRCVITSFSTVTACCFFLSFVVRVWKSCIMARNTYRTRIRLIIFMRSWNHVWKIIIIIITFIIISFSVFLELFQLL